MSLIISFGALFLSLIFLQLSNGGVGPLDALSGVALEFSKTQIGLLGSAHFFGFFLGCWWAPRLMGTVGHSRAFAAFTTLGAIGLLSHTLSDNPYLWMMMRVGSGLCISGCYTIIEAWLNDKVTNENRGRAMGSYRIVDTGAMLIAQMLIAVLEPNHYISYNILALLCCAAILPITLTRDKQPETPDAPRLRPSLAWSISPLASLGVVVTALSSSSFRMVGPLFGQEVGLGVDQIAFFLAASILGGAAAQYPVGWLADKFDRRWVLIGLSVAAIGSCIVTILLTEHGSRAVMASAVLFGFTTIPIFSVSAAHANDFASSKQRVELSAALMFFYALGAIASPYVVSVLIEVFNPGAMFVFVAVGHVLLIVFGVHRMRTRGTREKRTPYVYMPRSSFTIGRLLRRSRRRR